jgi:hypothetical protein
VAEGQVQAEEGGRVRLDTCTGVHQRM